MARNYQVIRYFSDVATTLEETHELQVMGSVFATRFIPIADLALRASHLPRPLDKGRPFLKGEQPSWKIKALDRVPSEWLLELPTESAILPEASARPLRLKQRYGYTIENEILSVTFGKLPITGEVALRCGAIAYVCNNYLVRVDLFNYYRYMQKYFLEATELPAFFLVKELRKYLTNVPSFWQKLWFYFRGS